MKAEVDIVCGIFSSIAPFVAALRPIYTPCFWRFATFVPFAPERKRFAVKIGLDENVELAHVRVCEDYIAPDWIPATLVDRFKDTKVHRSKAYGGLRIFVGRPANDRKD